MVDNDKTGEALSGSKGSMGICIGKVNQQMDIKFPSALSNWPVPSIFVWYSATKVWKTKSGPGN